MAYIGNKPANKAVVASDLDPAVITGQTALATSPASTDEFLISDAGTLKRLDASLIGGGKIGQVISATKTDTFTASSLSGAAAIDITGLSVAITPSATSSKILIIYNVHGSNATSARQSSFGIRLVRGSTDISKGDAAGNRQRVTATQSIRSQDDVNQMSGLAGNFLDSPSSTSATTYKIQLININSSSVNMHINRTDGNADDVNVRPLATSNITVMEVLA